MEAMDILTIQLSTESWVCQYKITEQTRLTSKEIETNLSMNGQIYLDLSPDYISNDNVDCANKGLPIKLFR